MPRLSLHAERRNEPGNKGRGESGVHVVEACQYSDFLPWKPMQIPDRPGNLTDLQKCFHCLGVPGRHDDLVGVNVVE